MKETKRDNKPKKTKAEPQWIAARARAEQRARAERMDKRAGHDDSPGAVGGV